MQLQLKRILFALLLFLPSFSSFASERFNGELVQEIEWEQLMPPGFTLNDIFGKADELDAIDDFDPGAQKLLDEMMLAMQSAPVVSEMDGSMVRVPGYVVPVESEGQRVTEFFLVPYFGACIHVPPPPSNQIIYVRFEPGTHVENLYDAVWVTGKLKTERKSHELATSGYRMEAFRIEPYQD